MADRDSHDAIRAFAQERRYAPATLARWLALAPGDARALLALAQELRLGENQLRDLWDWAEEIGQRDGLSLEQVLLLDPVAMVRRTRNVGRNDKLKLIKAALRRVRFPQLAATEERLAELVRQLDLPRNIRVSLPDFLEGDEVRVEIVAESSATLRVAADRLRTVADTPTCQEIFRLLEEAP